MIRRDLIKKLFLVVFCLLVAAGATAHSTGDEPENGSHPRFSPEEYRQKEMEYITNTADLTRAEANAFFPLFHQMKDRQRKLSFKNGKMMRDAWRKKLSNAESLAILDAIAENEEDIVELEEKYRKRFLKIVSASKLLKIKIAEKIFERRMLSNIAQGPRHKGPGKQADAAKPSADRIQR